VEGGTEGEQCPVILPKYRFTRYIYGSFTCRKAVTWDRRLYFLSEGRHAEDFFREPANLGTKGQHATSRPPKTLKFDVNKIIISEPYMEITNTAERILMKRKFKVEEFVV
jgi:hypothetical protein